MGSYFELIELAGRNSTKFKLQPAVEISYGKSRDEMFIAVGPSATS